jgi:hypothetical protein
MVGFDVARQDLPPQQFKRRQTEQRRTTFAPLQTIVTFRIVPARRKINMSKWFYFVSQGLKKQSVVRKELQRLRAECRGT